MIRNRARGCFLGQICGDAIGSCYEFSNRKKIINLSNRLGFEIIHPSAVFRTTAGQITDDTEMAVSLVNSFLEKKEIDIDNIKSHYNKWLKSKPFDIGNTVYYALSTGIVNNISQSNGSLMRCSPLAIMLLNRDFSECVDIIKKEAYITHSNYFVVSCNIIYVMVLRYIINYGYDKENIRKLIRNLIEDYSLDENVKELTSGEKPDNYELNCGWVKIAFQNAFYHLFRCNDIKTAISETIRMGGDTDTNAAIVGAMIGAVEGESSFPSKWKKIIKSCEPDEFSRLPRPKYLWVNDYAEKVDKILNCI